MTESAILDTDSVSEFLKGRDQNVARNADRYLGVHPKLRFSSVTTYEIVRGLEEKAAFVQMERFMRWRDLHEELLPSAEDYITAARTKARARRAGRTVELPDCLIAAVASRLDLVLVTGNTKDYEVIRATGLPLTLEDWRVTA